MKKEGEGGLVWFLFSFKSSSISQTMMQGLLLGSLQGPGAATLEGGQGGKISGAYGEGAGSLRMLGMLSLDLGHLG